LFDVHLHYDAEDAAHLAPEAIVAQLEAHRVLAALVTSRPPERVLQLHAEAPGLILPMLGVYRTPADKASWMDDAGLPERVEQALAEGPWRAVGELHLFAEDRRSPVFLRIVELATARGLPLQLHCDPAVIDTVLEQAPQATVIWAHAGAYPYPPLLRDYLQRYPGLYIDLSVRDERVAPDGQLDPEWELLLLEHSERFLVGVDTYRTERWHAFAEVVGQIRSWLDQLPEEVSRAIAYRNAARLFGQSVDY
jgi:predicted TIM-barrel fold metal-dependent hydrolase